MRDDFHSTDDFPEPAFEPERGITPEVWERLTDEEKSMRFETFPLADCVLTPRDRRTGRNREGATPIRRVNYVGTSFYEQRGEFIHGAIDIFGDEGVPVRTPLAGKVILSTRQSPVGEKGGHMCFIHSQIPGIGDVRILFTHLKEAPLVNEGDILPVNFHIGYVGKTGRARAAHLHFQVNKYRPNAPERARVVYPGLNPVVALNAVKHLATEPRAVLNTTPLDGTSTGSPPPIADAGNPSSIPGVVDPVEVPERILAITRGRTQAPQEFKYPYFVFSEPNGSLDSQTNNRILEETEETSSRVAAPYRQFFNQMMSLKQVSTLDLNQSVPLLIIYTTDENNNVVNLNETIFSTSPLHLMTEGRDIPLPERPIASLEGFDVTVQSPSVGGPASIVVGNLSIKVHNPSVIRPDHPQGKFIHWMMKQGFYLRIRYGNTDANPAAFIFTEDDFFISQHDITIEGDLSARIKLTVMPAASKLFNQVVVGESIPATFFAQQGGITNEDIDIALQSVLSPAATQEERSSLRNNLIDFQRQVNSSLSLVGTDTTVDSSGTLGSILHGALTNNQIITNPDGVTPILVRNMIEGLQTIQSRLLTRRFELTLERNAYTHTVKTNLSYPAINIGPLLSEMIAPEIQRIVDTVSRTGIRIGASDTEDETARDNFVIIFGNFNSRAGQWANKPISTFPINVDDIFSYIREERSVGKFSDTLNNFIGRVGSFLNDRSLFIPEQSEGRNFRLELPQLKYFFFRDPTPGSTSWIFYVYDNKTMIVNIHELLENLDETEGATNVDSFSEDIKTIIKTKCEEKSIPWLELNSLDNLTKMLQASTQGDDMIMSHNLYEANTRAFTSRQIDGSNVPAGIHRNFLAGTQLIPQDIIRATELIMPLKVSLDYFFVAKAVLFAHVYIFFPIKEFSGLYTIYEIGHEIKNSGASSKFTLQINIARRNRAN